MLPSAKNVCLIIISMVPNVYLVNLLVLLVIPIVPLALPVYPAIDLPPCLFVLLVSLAAFYVTPLSIAMLATKATFKSRINHLLPRISIVNSAHRTAYIVLPSAQYAPIVK